MRGLSHQVSNTPSRVLYNAPTLHRVFHYHPFVVWDRDYFPIKGLLGKISEGLFIEELFILTQYQHLQAKTSRKQKQLEKQNKKTSPKPNKPVDNALSCLKRQHTTLNTKIGYGNQQFWNRKWSRDTISTTVIEIYQSVVVSIHFFN